MCWEAAVSWNLHCRNDEEGRLSKGNLKKFYKNTSRHLHRLCDRIGTRKQKLTSVRTMSPLGKSYSKRKYDRKEVVMVESKLTKVKVNNEIELCEVYDSATKERIKKVFFREDISFFIKFKKKFEMAGFASVDLAEDEERMHKNFFPEQKEGRYIICVNKSQEKLARSSIMRVVPDYRDRIHFMDKEQKNEGSQSFFRELIAQLQ